MPKTHLNKQVLGDFLEANCERQLFLNLGEGNPKWIQPYREIKEPQRKKIANLVVKLGKIYEEAVYDQLLLHNSGLVSINPHWREEETGEELTVEYLNKLYDILSSDPNFNTFCLLEYDFETPEAFIRDLFGLDPSEDIPTTYANTLRPDIMIFGNEKILKNSVSQSQQPIEEPIGELMLNGNIEPISEKDLAKKIGIRVVDVKLTRSENVGKKYFFEIIFYCYALLYFLDKNDLRDKFFVRVDHNGIFPRYSDPEIQELKIKEISQKLVEMPFKDTQILVDTISEKLSEFKEKIPCKIESILLNLQSICAQCEFIEDCKKTLKYDEKNRPENYDLRLIPYTSQAIAEQLKDSNFPKYETIKDVLEKIDTHPVNMIPTPLYAEKPFLKTRAKALLKNEPIKPEIGTTYSIHIPAYSPISLIIDFEIDPIHNVIITCAFYISCYINQRWVQYDQFVRWWKLWMKVLNDKSEEDHVINKIIEEFGENLEIKNTSEIKTFLRKFKDALIFLDKNKDNNYWLDIDKKPNNGQTFYSKFELVFPLVNKGDNLKDIDENRFSEEIINTLYALVIFIQTLEWFIVEDDKFLNSAIFYWSQEQIDLLEEFLERNLDYLNNDPELRKKTLYILKWFNPSESEVKNPHHYKKFYDLRAFAETTMSFPLIINYTWHELATYLSKLKEYKKYFGNKEQSFYNIYWNPHFNYIDFQQWHRYLDKNKPEKTERYNQLKKQIAIKVRTLDKLRQIFQRYGKHYLLGFNKPKPMREFLDFELPEEYHYIAQIWYLFENYTTAHEEFEIDKIRCLYPSYGIAKLESAKVNSIIQIPLNKRSYPKYRYEFNLYDISSNVKMDEGDWIICVPGLLRDIPRYKNYLWKITIESSVWKGDHNEVVATGWNTNLLGNYIEELENSIPYMRDPDLRNLFKERIENLSEDYEFMKESISPVEIGDTFYLYPEASNPWGSKLESLLNKYNFGRSWLGHILSYRWGITKNPEIEYPENFPYKCWLPEVYMYSPKFIPSYEFTPERLMTSVDPPPDPSQKKAILSAMKNSIYGIQGPPGTGKTKTIAALIDEYLLRNKEKGGSSILVMAFSYAALRVVFQNIVESINDDGSPTEAAKSKLVFLRSSHRDPISTSLPVFDVYRKGENKLIVDGIERGTIEPISTITAKTTEKLDDVLNMGERNVIIFGNAHQLFHLNDLHYGSLKYIRPDFSFDMIIVDESSQVPVSHMLSALQYVKNFQVKVCSEDSMITGGRKITDLTELNKLYLESLDENRELSPENLTKVIIVGDQNQLPPVQQVKPPKKLESVLDNLFGYYADYHGIPNDQLRINYRSHQTIVDFTNYMGIYEHKIEPLTNKDKKIDGDLESIKKWNRIGGEKLKFQPWVSMVLNPEINVASLIHKNKYETAVSPLEADIVTQLVLGYYIMYMPDRSKVSIKELQKTQREFWTEKVGVVAPHNAQGRLIIHKIYETLLTNDLNDLEDKVLMKHLRKTIYSVEKFQGSARDMIITSIGISARDQLLGEEDFIYDLNRFNVLSSRARAKFIFISSENYLTYIPNDQELMQTASKIRQFASYYCSKEKDLEIIENKGDKKEILFRYRV